MKTPDYEEDYEQIGTVRFYRDGKKWRYIHAGGEGSGLASLEAAQAEIASFLGIADGNPQGAANANAVPESDAAFERDQHRADRALHYGAGI